MIFNTVRTVWFAPGSDKQVLEHLTASESRRGPPSEWLQGIHLCTETDKQASALCARADFMNREAEHA